MLDFLLLLLKIFTIMFVLLTIAAYTVFLERRVASFIQDRVGPNRVGPFGLLQPAVDAIKLIFKEAYFPENVDKILYMLGPVLVFATGLATFAVIPIASLTYDGAPFVGTVFGLDIGSSPTFSIADVDIGILFIIAIASTTAYGIAYGGWASYNKYSLLGGLRAVAQLISFEISMGLALVSLFMITGTVHLNDILLQQKGWLWDGVLPNWFVFHQPLAFIIFLVTAFAETNRLPFDIPEAEPELVAGYHTEYGSMNFGMFMTGEYIGMLTMSALIVTLFFGGWHLPPTLFGIDFNSIIPQSGIWTFIATATIFSVKVFLVIMFFIIIRWTLPRFRWDQLMTLGWKVLLPLALLNIFITGIVRIL